MRTFLVALVVSLLSTQLGVASPRASAPSPFEVPDRMQPRVNFWIDVFAKYGKHDAIIHHRNFPGVIFTVLNFSTEAEAMNPVQLERYIERQVKAERLKIEAAAQNLARGAEPANVFERHIADQMRGVPGSGLTKYRHLYQEKLVRYQSGIKEKYAQALARSGRYLPKIESIFVEEFGLPIELTRLPFVESSFDYKAYSSVGAAGIWQFMPRTARGYKMTINSLVDERRDPITATRGAARYLESAYRALGSWPLAVTSYNHGVGGVSSKTRKMGSRDIATLVEHPTNQLFGFASNNFYAEFLAAVIIYENHQKFFPGVQIEPPVQVVEYQLPHPASVSYITKRLGVEAAELERVNYALSRSIWRGASRIPAGYRLKVPVVYSARLEALGDLKSQAMFAQASTSSVFGGVSYRVRSGDTISTIAKKYHTTPSAIRELNDLSDDRIQVGQLLRVHEREDALKRTAESPVVPRSEPRDAVSTYRVKSGDSLHRIAKSQGVTIAALKAENRISGDTLQVGQVLRIPNRTGSEIPELSTAELAELPTKSEVRSYKVQSGDSLWTISKKLGVSVDALKRTNKLRSTKLKPGQVLTLP